MDLNAPRLSYEEWLSYLTDVYFKILHAISIYPYIIINIAMILISIFAKVSLLREDYQAWFSESLYWIIIFKGIEKLLPKKLRVYFLLILSEVYVIYANICYHIKTDHEKIYILMATFHTFFMEFLMFEVNTWLIFAIQAINLICTVNFEFIQDPSFDKMVNLTTNFLLIYLVASLFVVAYLRDLVLKEIFKYKMLIVKKQNNLQTVLENIPDGIIVLKAHKSPKLINTALKEILKIENKCEFCTSFKRLSYSVGRRLYPYNAETNLLKDVKDFISSGRSESVTFGVTEIDSRFYEWKGSISHWNNYKSLILLARDITALIELEKSNAIQVYQRAILRALSHELRTPLSVIISTSENIRSQSKLNEVLIQDKLSMISTNSKLLLNIINNLLDFVQITNNKFQLNYSYLNFKSLIQDTIGLFSSQANHKNILLASYQDSNIPSEIFNDSKRIQQVLINLLSNSLKFTQTGSIIIKSKLVDGKVKVGVKDTGIGISSQTLSLVFEPSRSINHSSKPLHGSGMKLHISNLIAKKLGNIPMKAKSIQGVGSTFIFYINTNINQQISEDYFENLETLLEHEDPIRLPSSRVMQGVNKNSPRILIVDDNEFNRLVVGEFLKQENLEYDEAINGSQAVRAVESKNNSGDYYSVIIMDCQMPVMDGWDATAKILELARAGAIRFRPAIIGYSAYCGTEEETKSREVGMSEFLIKPTPKHIFISAIKRYL